VKQPFTRGFPCPICGGYESLPRGRGQRCFGFLSSDGRYAHCTREEYAEGLPFEADSSTYAHRLDGPCRCGQEHGGGNLAQSQAPASKPPPKRRISATYRYLDEDGHCLFEVVRFHPKGFAQRRPCRRCGDPGGHGRPGAPQTPRDGHEHEEGAGCDQCQGGWIWNLKGIRRVLYRLPEVRNAVAAGDTIHVVEGEKDADALHTAGAVATCNSGGAGKWRPEFAQELQGADVVVWADRDRDGYRHAQDVIASLQDVASSARTVEAAAGKDAADHLAAGRGIDEAVSLDREILRGGGDNQESDEQTEKPAKHEPRSQASRLLDCVEDVHLFQTPQGEGFARIPIGDRLETWPIRSRLFRQLLAHRFFQRRAGAVPTEQSLRDATAVLEHRARETKDEYPAWLRVGRCEDRIGLDLCNPAWESVEVSAQGWEIRGSHEAKVRFRRTLHMRPLPQPCRGGSIEELREFVNFSSEADFRLLVGFLLGTLRPDGGLPILALHGEQASAKSTTASILRSLVDPHEAGIRADPKDPRDLAVAAKNSRILAFDNLSSLPPWMSDALCRLSTGGAFATRAHYTDDEEVLFSAQRPVILNGINELATRGDLLSRTIVVMLPRVHTLVPERELWERFEKARPRILGALLDAVVSALAREQTIELDRYPRLGDWARFVVAAEPALGWEPGVFLQALEENQAAANVAALEASPVPTEVRKLVDELVQWRGTATELLTCLEGTASEKVRKARAWPREPAHLSRILRRLAPNLRADGIALEFGREGGTGHRWIELKGRSRD